MIRRHPWRILVFLLLGAVVNVLVAWGCAAWSPLSKDRVQFATESPGDRISPAFPVPVGRNPEPIEWDFDEVRARIEHHGWSPYANPDEWNLVLSGMRVVNFGVTRRAIYGQATHQQQFAIKQSMPVEFVYDSGWPCRSLSGRIIQVGGGRPHKWKMIDAIDLSSPAPKAFSSFGSTSRTIDDRILPYQPLWFGMFINTLFYGMAIAVFWYVFVVSLWSCLTSLYLKYVGIGNRRRNLGHCPYCGHDLQHNLDGGCPVCGWKRMTSPRFRRMTRRAFTILILLILGTILNVLVAWRCAAWSSITLDDIKHAHEQYGNQYTRHPSFGKSSVAMEVEWDFDAARRRLRQLGWIPSKDTDVWMFILRGTEYSGAGFTLRVLTEVQIEHAQGTMRRYEPVEFQLTAGWPCRSVSGQAVHSSVRSMPTWKLIDAIDLSKTVTGKIPNQWSRTIQDRMLPYRPLWLGTVINAIFYAILYAIFHRWISRPLWRKFTAFYCKHVGIGKCRLRRGHCPQCNYNLQHNLDAGCAECGWNRAADR
jgi:hypothetical protein